MKKINGKVPVAVIGGGSNSAVGYAHFSAINLSNKFEIVTGVFSRSSEINKSTAETYGISSDKLYEDYKVMLEKEKNNIDAVIILTPSNQHAEQVIYSMKLGIPVVCEKSLTINSKEIKKIKTLAKKKFLSVVYNYVCYPMMKELKEMIDRGDFGKILQVQAEMQQEGFLRLKNGMPMKPQDWRLLDGDVPVISLDLGVHIYSLIKSFTKEIPIEVVGTENNFGNFSGIIDDVNCLIKYSGGMICNIWFSKTALGSRNGLRIRVFGTKKSAEWYQAEPEQLKMADNSGKIYTLDRSSEGSIVSNSPRYNRFKVGHPSGYIEALANFYEDVYIDLENFENNLPDRNTFGVNESEECIKLFETVARSAKQLSWEKIK